MGQATDKKLTKRSFAARINRRVRLIWLLILPSDSTQESDCSYSPLRHIGHFAPVFLSQFCQNLEIICRLRWLLRASHLHQKLPGQLSLLLTGTVRPLLETDSIPHLSPEVLTSLMYIGGTAALAMTRPASYGVSSKTSPQPRFPSPQFLVDPPAVVVPYSSPVFDRKRALVGSAPSVSLKLKRIFSS